jgi:hypothetical protein
MSSLLELEGGIGVDQELDPVGREVRPEHELRQGSLLG